MQYSITQIQDSNPNRCLSEAPPNNATSSASNNSRISHAEPSSSTNISRFRGFNAIKSVARKSYLKLITPKHFHGLLKLIRSQDSSPKNLEKIAIRAKQLIKQGQVSSYDIASSLALASIQISSEESNPINAILDTLLDTLHHARDSSFRRGVAHVIIEQLQQHFSYSSFEALSTSPEKASALLTELAPEISLMSKLRIATLMQTALENNHMDSYEALKPELQRLDADYLEDILKQASTSDNVTEIDYLISEDFIKKSSSIHKAIISAIKADNSQSLTFLLTQCLSGKSSPPDADTLKAFQKIIDHDIRSVPVGHSTGDGYIYEDQQFFHHEANAIVTQFKVATILQTINSLQDIVHEMDSLFLETKEGALSTSNNADQKRSFHITHFIQQMMSETGCDTFADLIQQLIDIESTMEAYEQAAEDDLRYAEVKSDITNARANMVDVMTRIETIFHQPNWDAVQSQYNESVVEPVDLEAYWSNPDNFNAMSVTLSDATATSPHSLSYSLDHSLGHTQPGQSHQPLHESPQR